MTLLEHLIKENYNIGRFGQVPKAIMIHVTTGDNPDSTLNWFSNPASGANANFIVDNNTDRVWNTVLDTDTAWHGGVDMARRLYLMKTRPYMDWISQNVSINWVTIGIEHVGLEHEIWPDLQYQTSAALIKQLAAKWKIPLDRGHIVEHREIYPGHPGCPGTGDLNRLIALAKAA